MSGHNHDYSERLVDGCERCRWLAHHPTSLGGLICREIWEADWDTLGDFERIARVHLCDAVHVAAWLARSYEFENWTHANGVPEHGTMTNQQLMERIGAK